MANDKKFIVKNGLLTQENVIIGSSTDNGTDRLQVTGSSLFSGATDVTQSASATPTLKVTNDGGSSAVVARFTGDAEGLDFVNFTAGDYAITNTGQDNGIRFYNNTSGVEIMYNNSVDLEFSATGIDFKREPSYNGSVFWNAGNDGAGSGLDADVLDGLDSLQFLRSDEDDTMTGSLTITGNLTVSGTTTTVNTQQMLIADNIFTLNSDFTTGSPTENAGFEILRGDSANSELIWDETNDWWKLISAGTDLGRIITTADEGSGNEFDADTVDGLEAAQFLRSDEDDTTTGNLTVEGNLTVGDGNGTSFLYMDGAGSNGILAGTAGEIGFLNSAFNFGFKLNTSGDAEVRDDIYAQNFIDINDNTYKIDGDGDSVLHSLGLDDDLFHNGDVDTKIGFATDAIRFNTAGGTRLTVNTTAITSTLDVVAPRFVDADNNSYLADPSGASVFSTLGLDSDLFHNGDTDTKIAFDTNEIGFETNGTERLNVADAAVTSTVDVRAPKFVDSNDTAYYGDFASTSIVNNIALEGSIHDNGDTETSISFGDNNINFETGGTTKLAISNTVSEFTGLVTADDLDVYSGDPALGEMNVGIAGNQRFNFNVTDSQGYIRYYQDETGSTTNHSVNFEIQSTSTYPHKFTFNKDVNLGGNTVEAGSGIFTSAVYAPKYWDSNDVTHYADFGNTGTSLYFAGQSQGGDGTSAAPTYSFKSDTNTGMFRGASDRLDFSAGGNVELQVLSTYAAAPSSFRAPAFYDLDNTAYVGNFAGNSVMHAIGLDDDLFHNGDTDTRLRFGTNTVTLTAGNVNSLDLSSTLATFGVKTQAPRFVTNDFLAHTGNENTYIGFNADNTFGVWTAGGNRLSIDNDSADFSINVYAPRYYDSDNNSYFLDPAAASTLHAIGVDDEIYHNGDTDTRIVFTDNDISLATGGTERLGLDNDSADFGVAVYAPVYYDTAGTTDFLNLGSTAANDALRTRGRINIGGGTDVDRWDDNANQGGITLSPYQGHSATSNPTISVSGNNGGHALAYFNRIDIAANPYSANNRYFSFSADGVEKVTYRGDSLNNHYVIMDGGGTWSVADSGANFVLSATAGGDVVVGDQAASFATADVTPQVGSINASKLHVNGSVQINSDNDALIVGRGTSSYFKNNDLGFGQGGGFYMDDAATIKVRGNKAISTTGNISAGNFYGARYYDSGDNNYYLDAAGDSQLNTIDIDDYVRHRGDTNTYFGFQGDEQFRIATNNIPRLNIDNDSADFTINVYAPRYYDSNDVNYYLDPAGESQLNRVDINDYIRHRGDTNNYFGFAANDTFRVFTGGGQRLNIDNDSADFGVNVYAPRFYDSNNNNYYVDPAATSILAGLTLNNTGGDTVLKFGPGVPASDDAHIEFKGTSDAGYLRFSTSDDSGTEYMEFGDYADANRGGSFTRWMIANRSYIQHQTEMRAPRFADANNPAFYVDPASISLTNVMRANQFQVDGSAITIDSASGSYGSIKVGGTRGGYSGYAIEDDWVFMANGTANAGIYNDTRNEWVLQAFDNNRTRIYSNGVEQLSAENGYGFAVNSMRSPIFYDSNDSTFYGNFGAGNTSTALNINGRINRTGFATGNGDNNKIITAEDRNHWIWNTATNWGVFWATDSSSSYRDSRSTFGDNTISFVGNGNLRAAIDLDTGNILSNGEIFAGNYNLSAGNESVPLNPAYGVGTSEQKLFDGNLYWEKRAIQALRGNENSATGSTSEYVKSTDAPGSSSYVLRTAAYRDFYSDMIEVEPGEEVYGEMWVKYISGSGGLFYYGIERFDKDKNPIAGNTGTAYFVAGGNNVTSASWQKFSGHTTIPTSHTAFGGSDGGGVRYVRIRVLMNYSTGGALREFTAPILTRTNVQSRIRTDQAIYSPVYYDSNDTNFYLDPASTSKLNTVDASNFRDRDNTARFMNPNSGGNVQGTWNWNNGTIDNLNNLTFNDPGPSEGIKWNGGNSWQIYESPDDLSTNSGGNLQFTSGGSNGTMRGRIDVNGDVWAGRYMRAQRFYDSNDGNYYADPAGSSIFANLYLRTGGLKLQRNYGDNAIWFNSGTDTNHVLWNHYYGGPTTRGAAASGGFDGMRWNTYQGLDIRGGTAGAFNIARFRTDGAGNGNAHYVSLYANNVEQLGTRAGYGFAPNSMRSPIFYDSNDAAYYGDFASTSRMNVINANMYSLNDGWDIYDDDSNTLSIRSNNSDNGEILFRDSNSTITGRIYFDDDSHWGFKSPDDEWQIYLERNARTILYYNGTQQARTQDGYFEANNQMRAPIYYDSNDTGFYANPNATSRFRGLTVLEDITAPGITGSSGSLRRRDNRVIAPNEDTSGEMKFGFTSWSNNNTSPYADYLHLRSYTDASGGSDNLVMFKKSGIGMRIWQQSWNSGTAYATYRNVPVYNENPDGSGNNLYAARYYDEDNTSYYADPAGRSIFNDVLISNDGELTFRTSSGAERGYIKATETDDAHLIIATSGGEDISFRDGGFGGGVNFRIRGDGNTFTTGTHYAQRFTDLNNTGYYADPASTSVMNIIDARGEIYNDGWFRNDTGGRGLYSTPYAQHFMAVGANDWRLYGTGSTQALQFATSGNNVRGYVYANNSNDIGFLNNSGNWALRTRGSTTEVYGNLYADIMYDRNNSGYYVNPASQSHMNTLTLAGNRLGFVNSSFDAEIRVSDSNPDGTGATFTFWGDTVEYNAEVASEVFRATRHMRAGRYYDIDNSTFFVEPASTSYFNSIQADILYDRNNTAYYWNGASTNSTRFLGVNTTTMAYMALPGHTRNSGEYYRARPRQTGDTNYWTGAMGWGRNDMNVVGTWGSGFIDSWSSPPNQPAGTSHWVGTQAYHYRSSNTNGYGWQMVGGPIENLRFRSSWGGWRSWRTIPVLGVNSNNDASMYASIYYDANNSGYYCDPSSFSNLNTGVRATEFYARNWFRNDNAREGMYNQATGAHSYSYQGQYWAITGNNNSSSMSLQLRATYNGTMCRWMYGDRTWSGDLNAAGQWQLQTRHQDGYSPTLRFIESGNESWTGNIGNDAGKIEYHSNRFYIESGGNSNRIVQFRRNGSNRSYIDNNGLYVGTATSARWADLAERYSADAIYENATVMGINLDGESEITKWEPGMPLVGVISTNPAVQMNDMGIKPGSKSKKAKMNPFIALKGRIPCLVSEPVKKGQWVIPAGDGKAKGVDYGTPGIGHHEIIGIALSDSENGEVEVKV